MVNQNTDQQMLSSQKAQKTDIVNQKEPRINLRVPFVLALSFLVVVIFSLSFYALLPKQKQKEKRTAADKVTPTSTPLVNLNDVTNIGDFNFSGAEMQSLAKNGFVVSRAFFNEFFPIYEGNRYDFTPSFITTDSILHNYHLIFDYLLRRLEEERLSPALKRLNESMLSEAVAQYDYLRGTKWENAAKRNVGFFAVGSKLLNPSTVVPQIVANEVNQELSLIGAHQGIAESPVMNMGNNKPATIETPQGPLPLEAAKEDYSQYIPRGHYTQSSQLKNYFKAMTWYGRLTFRVKNEDEMRSALLITLSLNKAKNQNIWEAIYQPINFFVGKADDVNYYQFKKLLSRVYGPEITLQSIANDKNRFSLFINQAYSLKPPRLNSIPIFQASFQNEKEKEIRGFRFMGQRFTIDANIFQQLIYRNVGDKSKPCQEYKPTETGCLSGARCLPKGLDIPAALGSNEAEKILREMGETKYACYSENMTKLRKYISGLSDETWTQNLYWSWLYQLLPLLKEKPESYPVFMQSSAWRKKNLNTFLGSWTELKHDTILYTKQVYAELGGGGKPERRDDRGYVEPEPDVYARLITLLGMTKKMLKQQNLLPTGIEDNLGKMERLTTSLKLIAEKELNGKELTEQDHELIRSYGGQLEHFWIEVNKDNPQYQKTEKELFLQQNPAALVADVATNPNGQVLEEGVGKIFLIYVIVPINNKLRLTKGGVYSYYEFKQPMANRLTDRKWQQLLESDHSPSLPFWTKSFIAK